MSTCCHRPTHTSVIHTFDCSNAFYICLFFVFVPSTCRSHLHPTNVFQRVYATICAAPWRLQKFIIHFTPHPYPTHTYKYIMTIPHQHGIHIPQQKPQDPSSLLSTRHPTPFPIPPPTHDKACLSSISLVGIKNMPLWCELGQLIIQNDIASAFYIPRNCC